MLSVILSTLYILFGNFRALLTFNGLGEYTFFFLAVLGNIILRYREPDLARPYKPIILFPLIFLFIAAFIVLRGAIFAPGPAGTLIALWIIGVAFHVVRKRSGYGEP